MKASILMILGAFVFSVKAANVTIHQRAQNHYFTAHYNAAENEFNQRVAKIDSLNRENRMRESVYHNLTAGHKTKRSRH